MSVYHRAEEDEDHRCELPKDKSLITAPGPHGTQSWVENTPPVNSVFICDCGTVWVVKRVVVGLRIRNAWEPAGFWESRRLKKQHA